MLKKHLDKIIPEKVRIFPKLSKKQDPYHFDSWDQVNGEPVLRYWFWNKNHTAKNTKRVFIKEIEGLIEECCKQGIIKRASFKSKCPKTDSDGPCGFAVGGRILEALGVAKYDKKFHGFKITDSDEALKLIDLKTEESKKD